MKLTALFGLLFSSQKARARKQKKKKQDSWGKEREEIPQKVEKVLREEKGNAWPLNFALNQCVDFCFVVSPEI